MNVRNWLRLAQENFAQVDMGSLNRCLQVVSKYEKDGIKGVKIGSLNPYSPPRNYSR